MYINQLYIICNITYSIIMLNALYCYVSLCIVIIRRPLVAVRGSAPRKLLQKIVVERWGTWRARLGTSSCCGPVGTALLKAPARIRCFVRLVCCFAWLEHESCCCSSVSKALLHGTSSCCGPVGTALPKAPARIRCFVQLVCGFAWFGHYFFLFKLFNGFQKRRFGIFPAAVSQWLGHKTCWGSAFSHARPKHLFLEFGLVACRLPSLTLRKGLPCLRQPFFLFLVGSKSNVSAFFSFRHFS